MPEYFFKDADKASLIDQKNVLKLFCQSIKIYFLYYTIDRKHNAFFGCLNIQIIGFLLELLTFTMIDAI